MTIFGLSVDEFVKLASMVGAIFVAAAAVIAYYDKGTREQKKPFYEARLDLCRDTAEAVATLASLAPRSGPETGEEVWHRARARFEQLYWGSLAVVEDEALEARMAEFRKLLIDCESEILAGALEKDKG